MSAVPINGAKLYAPLMYLLRGAWYSFDYIYTEAPPAPPTLQRDDYLKSRVGPTACWLTVGTAFVGAADV